MVHSISALAKARRVRHLGVAAMKDLEIIGQVLHAAAARLRTTRALHGLWLGLLAGSGLSLVLSAIYHLLPIGETVLYWIAALPFAGMLLGWLMQVRRRPDLTRAARWLDRRQHLQERLSTAWESLVVRRQDTGSAAPEKSPWNDILLKDAADYAAKLDARKVLPYHLTRAAYWGGFTLLLLSILGFVPEYRSEEHLRQQREAANIRETGRRIAELTRRSIEKQPPVLPSTQSALKETIELGDRIALAPPVRDIAMADLSNAAERLRQAAAELASRPGVKQMQQAAESSGASPKSGAELQKQISALQQELGNAASTEKIQQLRKGLESVRQQAQAMKNAKGPDAAQQEKLGAALAELASQAQAMGLNVPDLQEAMQALAASQTDLFLDHLDATLVDLEKLAQLAQSLQALQAEAAKLGRDLAEQLERGQGEAARDRLEEFAGKLNSGALDAKALENLLGEVSKAIDPAGKYGEVAKHLQGALKALKEGSQSQASNDLKLAADELARLMKQAADAESLLASMRALQEASMCLGNGQCFMAGSNMGRKPGTGAGVGTWSDAKQQWDGTTGQMPDNSGFDRAGMESRSGLAEPEKGPALTASRVRGQITPGGEMPSIPLRGVGIRGQSKLAYEQAATAAQAEAESALGQDKVPRAYRDSVKNYFDDLKQ